MSANRSHVSAVSLHLSRVLDVVGVNDLTVRRRRQSTLSCESLMTVSNRLLGHNYNVYRFGSQSEGTTSPGLHSDIDTLLDMDQFHVIQRWEEWIPEKPTLLMLQEDTAPGYCRLQHLRLDMPLPLEQLPNSSYAYDSSNRVILKNTILNLDISLLRFQPLKNGPAITPQMGTGFVDEDIIIGLKCCSDIPVPDKWTRRNRRRYWPEPGLLQKAIEQPFFLVPVGYKLSQTENLEWRISMSLSERQLMFDMNMTQIKCYVVLKMIIKTFITPVAGKSITSYHCKTAVLHCMENNESEFWKEDNLLNCITECLNILNTWLSNRFCPKFMIPDANLFAGKVNAQNQRKLQSILTTLLESNGRFLLHVDIDDIGLRLGSMLSRLPQRVSVIDSLETTSVIAATACYHYKITGDRVFVLLTHNAAADRHTLVQTVYQYITSLYTATEHADGIECVAIQIHTQFLATWLGSLLSAASLSRKQRIPQAALRWFGFGNQSDIASSLKLASVFYCNGDFRKVEHILLGIEERFLHNDILVFCTCYIEFMKIHLSHEQMVKMCHEDSKNRDKYVAHCVRFTPQEKHCAPPALRHELCRSTGDDIQYRVEYKDEWMVLGVVDSLPYLYYLQYINYKKLEKRDVQKKSLDNLYQCVRNNKELRHLEAAWNLFGQCMELEQKREAAMDCYRTSLEIRPRNNAANWHVQNLRYKQIRDGTLYTPNEQTRTGDTLTPYSIDTPFNITFLQRGPRLDD